MKWLKRIAILIGVLIVGVFSTGALFVNISPQFGDLPSATQNQAFKKTGHYKDGKFLNLEPFSMQVDCHSISAMLKKMFNPPEGLRPKVNIEVQKIDTRLLSDGQTRIFWLGHSSILIRLAQKTILLDPMFGQVAAPHPWLGMRRYSKEMPIKLKELPSIDFVVISHDHYDHLDYETIRKIASKTKKFLTPLGVGSHLRKWGVKPEKIIELDWWQESQQGSIKFVSTPAQHMSGRGLSGQSSTLWGSWVLKGTAHNLYFSGDGGYGAHFKKIGAKYGPFDIGLMECGQYDELWPRVHLTPEQTVQAGMEVKAKVLMPIHWGAFTLANHVWADPVVRFTAAARTKGQPVSTPMIGQPIVLNEKTYPTSRWWERYMQALPLK